MPGLTLLTPTFRRDLERFALQRESIERCGIDLPHLAIVNTEDLDLFQRIPFQKNLTFLTTRQVLGKTMDRRRQVWRVSRKDYRYWITPAGIAGWLAQQLMKFAAAEHISTDAYLCLDSDAFFVRPIFASDFFSDDGRLHLYETDDDVDVEMAEWYAHSLRFLGVKETGVSLRRFTHSPVPMHRGVVRDLLAHIEKQHGISWMEAIVRGDRITEYTTYGAYARHVDELARVWPVRPSLAVYYWWHEEGQSLHDDFHERLASGNPKIVLINSNMGFPAESYRNLVAAAWPVHLHVPA